MLDSEQIARLGNQAVESGCQALVIQQTSRASPQSLAEQRRSNAPEGDNPPEIRATLDANFLPGRHALLKWNFFPRWSERPKTPDEHPREPARSPRRP
ncbi:MAG: hypothetical protein QOI84_1637 [Solirubrobacterales bacterium]|nr:hypothetical protein [Solirubrobacterales bacterium]